ncbi:MAG: DUF2905 domain-containing protein [Anaerolineae bacterium]|nr:DUF2905 domain-containing protein [Anaerolineae bacterium]
MQFFELNTLAKWLIVIGVGIATLGILLFLLGKIPGLNRLGQLPGDIRYQSPDGRVSCFIPVVSSILISVIFTIVLNIVLRIINRP